jgi:hypothetical protein
MLLSMKQLSLLDYALLIAINAIFSCGLKNLLHWQSLLKKYPRNAGKTIAKMLKEMFAKCLKKCS